MHHSSWECYSWATLKEIGENQSVEEGKDISAEDKKEKEKQIIQ